MAPSKIAIGCLAATVVILLAIIAVMLGLYTIFSQELPLQQSRHPAPGGGSTAILVTHAGGGAAGWVYSELFLQTPDGARTLVPRDPFDDASRVHWTGPTDLSVCMDSVVVSQRVRLSGG